MRNISKKNVICLILAVLMLLSFASCGEKIKASNEAGETTVADVKELQKEVKKVVGTKVKFEDKIKEIMFSQIQKVNGTEYYEKWYKPSMVSNANLLDIFDGTTLKFYFYFEDDEIDSKMETVLTWAEKYFNDLGLGINVQFQSLEKEDIGNYRDKNLITDWQTTNTDYNTGKKREAWAYCDQWYCNLIDGRTSIKGLAFRRTEIVMKAKMTECNDERYEFIFLHELGHALGLAHANGDPINQGNDYFLEESVMAESSASSIIHEYDGHAAYYTIDYEALRLLYGDR